MDPNYHASDKHWRTIEALASCSNVSDYSCILELRARIEALEAAQQQPDHLPDATEMVNTGWRNLHDLSPIMEPAPTRPDPPAPAGGLVDGICRELPLSPGEARAVVRVVAAWLRSDGPDWPSVASLLEQEANQ